MLRNLLAALIGGTLIWFGVRAAMHALASPETRVRWVVEGMEQGYAANRLNAVIGPIAADWSHAGEGRIDRSLLADGLRHRFFTERAPQTRERLDRVEIDWDTWTVEVEGDAAIAGFELQVLERRAPGEYEPSARAALRTEFELLDGKWLLVHSSHADLEGSLH